MTTGITVILCVIAIIAAVIIASVVSVNRYKATSEKKIGSAEEKAREIIDEALKTAET